MFFLGLTCDCFGQADMKSRDDSNNNKSYNSNRNQDPKHNRRLPQRIDPLPNHLLPTFILPFPMLQRKWYTLRKPKQI